MKIVFKKVSCSLEILEIENTLENLQKLVGGYIEEISMPNNIKLLCDEDGKLKKLEPNINSPYGVLLGNIIFVGDNGDDYISLNEQQIQYLKEIF